MIGQFLPGWQDLPGVAASLTIWLGLSAIGQGARRGAVMAGTDFFVGWGVASLVMVAFGLAGIPFRFALWILAAVAAVAMVRFGLGSVGRLWRGLAVFLPLLVLVAGMHGSQWDEFSHWLEVVKYLVTNEAFPGPGRPPSPASYPAYPYGWPFLIYAASAPFGRVLENVGPLLNTLMVVNLAMVAVESDRPGERPALSAWALALLGFTLLSPGFVAKLVFTAYADQSTGVALAMLLALAWRMIEALRQKDGAAALALAWPAALVATAFLGIKETNFVLFAVAVAAAALLGLHERLALRTAWKPFAIAVVVPLLAWLAWQVYVRLYLPGADFKFQPLGQWNIGIIPSILATMLGIAARKSGYFLLSLAAVGFAVRYVLSRRGGAVTRLAMLYGLVFLAFNLFLFFTYVAAFGPGDAMRAASYWRYNTQLGPAATLLMLFTAREVWRARPRWQRHARALGVAAVALALASPVVAAKNVRFDLVPGKVFVRGLLAEVAATANAMRLFVVDLRGTGLSAMMAKYALGADARLLGYVGSFHADTVKIMGAVLAGEATHVLVITGGTDIDPLLPPGLPPAAVVLLARRGGGWEMVRHWPYPGGNSPAI